MDNPPNDVCAAHGKKRGPRNLRPNPSNPGQFICLEEDPCKVGSAGPPGAPADYGAAASSRPKQQRFSPYGAPPAGAPSRAGAYPPAGAPPGGPPGSFPPPAAYPPTEDYSQGYQGGYQGGYQSYQGYQQQGDYYPVSGYPPAGGFPPPVSGYPQFPPPPPSPAYDAAPAAAFAPPADPPNANEAYCAVHGRKRGQRNLQASPTVPGQFVCRDDDQCKGGISSAGLQAAASLTAYPPAMPLMADMAGMGGMGVMPAVDVYSGVGAGMENPSTYSGLPYVPPATSDMENPSTMFDTPPQQTCANHGKRRGERFLQPHPEKPGLYICQDTDPCKTGGGAGGGTLCAMHGKRRGAKNLQTNGDGQLVCYPHDVCK